VNVVDSSGWLEYFAAGPNAGFFAPALEAVDDLVVPTVSVCRFSSASSNSAVRATRSRRWLSCSRATWSTWSVPLALDAARLSVELQIPMADAIILTTARANGATLWTQDSHFEGMTGVEYVPVASD
jgi:predicted nucleic acid-binding protein